MIELKNISKMFVTSAGKVKALDNITLIIPEGDIFAIVGSSGAGKSTLIRCVNLLERPSAGAVIVDGVDLTGLSKESLRKARHKIGMIFQHFNLLSNRTVLGNITLPLELAGYSHKEITAAVTPLLELTGLDELCSRYPGQLSGGEKQRVAIARALASKPRVLLCDEATSALDPKTTRTILSLLKDINQQLNITILMITHEMNVVKSICDRVAILSYGELIEENFVDAFFMDPKTDIAREFVRSAFNEKQVTEIESRFQKIAEPGAWPVVRITFVGDSVVEPLITQAARICNTDFIILQANIETVGGKVMGCLTVEIMGDESNYREALAFLEKRVQVEVLGYVC